MVHVAASTSVIATIAHDQISSILANLTFSVLVKIIVDREAVFTLERISFFLVAIM
jgi:hypothetical protein